MGWMDAGLARARAAASDASADLAEVNSRLGAARTWMAVTGTSDSAARRTADSGVGRLAPVAPITALVASQTAALHSRAIATVDELTARQEAARNRLSLARKSQSAMTRIASETDKVLGE